MGARETAPPRVTTARIGRGRLTQSATCRIILLVATTSAPFMESPRPSLAPDYHLERVLGSGGSATVYLAADVKHDRQVAIKVLHQELSATVGAERFLREIRVAARLTHPNIVPLLDSGRADGCSFYV